jgi:predicted AAA+ superfamily ATPase
MIPRVKHIERVIELLEEFPVVTILGARQVGKSTLARQLISETDNRHSWFDLEDSTDLARLAEPKLALERLEGLVVLDEVQRAPNLFEVIRTLVDRPSNPARFLVLGSASPDLLKQSSETLAGRVAYYELDGFTLGEAGQDQFRKLWLRGRFPMSFLARSNASSLRWRKQFVRTFLEMDLPMLGITIPATTIRRFWSMLAHYHGQIWNASEIAGSFGISHTTVRRYLDLMCSTYVTRILQPWHENLGKRQVKTPKVYFRDSGLLHVFLGIEDWDGLEGHPKLGASFEGFAMHEVIDALEADAQECFFWRTHNGAELDLLVIRGRRRLGFEFKRTASPRTGASMRIAMKDLGLDSLDVIYPGDVVFPMSKGVRAVPVNSVAEEINW